MRDGCAAGHCLTPPASSPIDASELRFVDRRGAMARFRRAGSVLGSLSLEQLPFGPFKAGHPLDRRFAVTPAHYGYRKE